MSGRFLDRASERIIDIGAEGPDEDEDEDEDDEAGPAEAEAEQAEANDGSIHGQGDEHENAAADVNGHDDA